MACRRTQTGRTIYFVEQAAFRQWREEVTSWYKVITAESFAMERQATASKHRGRISTSKREGSTNSNKTYCHPPPLPPEKKSSRRHYYVKSHGYQQASQAPESPSGYSRKFPAHILCMAQVHHKESKGHQSNTAFDYQWNRKAQTARP